MPFIPKWIPAAGDIVSLRSGVELRTDDGVFVYPQEFTIIAVRGNGLTVQDLITKQTAVGSQVQFDLVKAADKVRGGSPK